MFARRSFIQQLKSKCLHILILGVLTSLPFLGLRGYWLDILARTNLFLIISISLDFFSGTTYYLNLGHSFIVGLAAYILALLNVYYGTPIEIGVIISTAATTILSLILFLPGIRVKGFYFTVVSLLFPIIFIHIATTQPFSLFLGGEGGLRSKYLFYSIIRQISPKYRIQFLSLGYYYISLSLAVISYAVLYKLAYSDFGFMMRALGQDEELAEVSGIDTLKFRLKGFLVSSFFASLAGSFYAAMRPPVTINFASTSSILMPALTAMVVGGTGSIVGTAIAGYILSIIYELLWSLVGMWRTAIYMTILIIFVLLKPQGIVFSLYIKFRATLRRVFNI